MNYIGSKYSLLSFLDESISSVVDDKCKIFCDLFAGTGMVGSYFKKKGYQIIANDIQYYSYILNKHYIGNHKELIFEGLEKDINDLSVTVNSCKPLVVCNYLSSLQGIDGFIFNNYCFEGTKNKEFERQYFSDFNGRKCDAIRQEIEKLNKDAKINEDEYFFLLASLIESIDKYANTASVYGAFLKHLKKTAQKEVKLVPAEIIINSNKHKVYNEDINSLIKKIKGDILYLDPPYNHRQYCANYHLLETIAKYDEPEINGKTGLRNYSKEKSAYCSKRNALKTFEELILNADFKFIFLSYNNEGLMSLEEIKHILEKRGEYGSFTTGYNRFKADKDENREFTANSTIEYLHYVICK